MQLTDFNVLTFDCYGTLIDWEAGILAGLAKLVGKAGVSRDEALETFAKHESAQEAETGAMPYSATVVGGVPAHGRGMEYSGEQ